MNKISWSVIGITNIVLRGKFMGLGESDIYEQKGEIMKYKFEGKTINVTLGNKNYKVKLERGSYDYKVKLEHGSYEGGRIAILGYLSDGEPFSTLSVNIPDIKLLEDEILIKNWSENEAFAKSALQSGYFLNTGKSVRTGFVEAPIWLLIREGDI